MSLKKTGRVLAVVNIIFLIVFLCTLTIPVSSKTVKYMNTDISAYSGKNNMPLVGAITNNRTAEFEFYLYNEKLYGICLYFYVEGPEEGRINATLLFDGEKVAEEAVEVKELSGLMDTAGLSAKEFVMNDVGQRSGKYTFILQGEGISPQTRISFFANDNTEQYIKFVNQPYRNSDKVLYMIEIAEEKRQHIWGAAFLLILGSLLSGIVYIGQKEKQSERIDEI